MAGHTQHESGYRRAQHFVFHTIEDLDTKTGRIFGYCLMTLIALNVIAEMAETLPKYANDEHAMHYFHIFEAISIYIFTLEVLLRIWACTEDEKFRHPVKGRIKFCLQPLTLLDIAAVIPFYLPKFTSIDGRALRTLRLLKLFHLSKAGIYSRSVQRMGRVLKANLANLLVIVFAVLLLLVISSTLVWHAEHAVEGTAFISIPATLWWAINTMVPVGYGDMVPVTDLGKLWASITAVLGISLFVLPAAVLAGAFTRDVGEKLPKGACPHCGKSLASETEANGDKEQGHSHG